MEEPSLGERILAHDRESASHRRATHTQDTRERSTHGDLLAAAERTRRARDTRSELLPEFTGLTAGEALARLAEEEQAAPRTPSAVDAPPRTAASKPAAALPRTAGTKAQSAVPAPTASSAQKTPVKPTQKQDETEEKPRFEVRV